MSVEHCQCCYLLPLRSNIPVVIMGETGCGKTRLIRYMCDVAAQGCIKGGQDVKNMLIMKVWGVFGVVLLLKCDQGSWRYHRGRYSE